MTENAPDHTGRNGAVVPQGLHVVAKPIGPACNLDCDYCFYLEKQALFAPGEQYRMTDRVLSAFITGYIASQPTPVVEDYGIPAPYKFTGKIHKVTIDVPEMKKTDKAEEEKSRAVAAHKKALSN